MPSILAQVVIAESRELPSDIGSLRQAADSEGFRLVARLVDEWEDGSNRFDRPGEVLVEARLESTLAAVGGLNQDPYLDDPRIARIRHVYVLPEHRGSGIGRLLVGELVDRARAGFDRVRLRAGPADASAFYEAIGFAPTRDEPDCTHDLTL